MKHKILFLGWVGFYSSLFFLPESSWSDIPTNNSNSSNILSIPSDSKAKLETIQARDTANGLEPMVVEAGSLDIEQIAAQRSESVVESDSDVSTEESASDLITNL